MSQMNNLCLFLNTRQKKEAKKHRDENQNHNDNKQWKKQASTAEQQNRTSLWQNLVIPEDQ